MADSASERGAQSDSDDDGEPGFDPAADLSKLSDKEKRKREANLHKWRIFIDFLFRHIAIATFRYNCFENEELTKFMLDLEKAEEFRSNMKLKKKEEPRICNFKMMKECSEMLMKQRHVNEANRIKRFLDIAGRMKGINMIASSFYKALKKGKVRGLDKMKHYLDFWKGFTSRTYDFSQLDFLNVDPESFNELEKKYLLWPTVVRTSLNLSQKFLKKTSESTGLELVATNPATLQQHMQAAEFVVAAKIEETLFQRVVVETKTFLQGLSNPLVTPGAGTATTDKKCTKWELPPLEDIDPKMIKPIPDDGMLLCLPAEPPKDKKRKKGKGKGKKGRGFSPSTHKKGKKKKRK